MGKAREKKDKRDQNGKVWIARNLPAIWYLARDIAFCHCGTATANTTTTAIVSDKS